jgi:hypothetical protein
LINNMSCFIWCLQASPSYFSIFSFVMIPYPFCDISTPNNGMHNLHNYGHFFLKNIWQEIVSKYTEQWYLYYQTARGAVRDGCRKTRPHPIPMAVRNDGL